MNERDKGINIKEKTRTWAEASFINKVAFIVFALAIVTATVFQLEFI